MGGKQSRRGKPIYFCLALLIFLSPAACTLNRALSPTMVDATGEEALKHLALGREFLNRGDYGNALQENEKVLLLAGRNIPMDEALFYVGLIHALPTNPARNYGRSVATFRRLIKEYPGSSLLVQAKAMVELLQENDQLSRKAEKSDTTIDELKKRVDRLNTIIDELKKIDIGVDKKKKEQTK